jgi:hypothetical protein
MISYVIFTCPMQGTNLCRPPGTRAAPYSTAWMKPQRAAQMPGLRSCAAAKHGTIAPKQLIVAPSQPRLSSSLRFLSCFFKCLLMQFLTRFCSVSACFVSARSGALQVLLFESLTTAKGLRVRGRVEQGAVWPCKWRILPSEYLQVRVRIKHGSS